MADFLLPEQRAAWDKLTEGQQSDLLVELGIFYDSDNEGVTELAAVCALVFPDGKQSVKAELAEAFWPETRGVASLTKRICAILAR